MEQAKAFTYIAYKVMTIRLSIQTAFRLHFRKGEMCFSLVVHGRDRGYEEFEDSINRRVGRRKSYDAQEFDGLEYSSWGVSPQIQQLLPTTYFIQICTSPVSSAWKDSPRDRSLSS